MIRIDDAVVLTNTGFAFLKVMAHDKNERYKEGKFVLERY